MINNNPYNIPQKKPLSQSKILSDTNTSRHSSAYLQNRNGNQIMYSSSIFLKNPAINGVCQQSFFEPIKQPLSPHHAKYSKQPPATFQFVPSYNQAPLRSPENHFFPPPIPKETYLERGLNQLRQKIDQIEKKLEAKERKQLALNDLNSKKLQNWSQIDSVKSMTDDSFQSNAGLRQLIDAMVQSTFEAQNRRIWQKLNQMDDSSAFSMNNSVAQKISQLQQSFTRFQSDKHTDDHLHNRLKTIEKTIREMGEDIHLVNDKQESLSSRLQTQLPAIRSQIKSLKIVQKRLGQSQKKNDEMRSDIQQLSKKMKMIEVTAQSAMKTRMKDIELKLQNLKQHQINKDVKSSFQRCFTEPIILKYIEKFQIIKPLTNNYSHSSSTNGQSTEQIIINDITYYIDHEGYLLDNDRYYLTHGTKNQRVRLDSKHISALKDKKILI